MSNTIGYTRKILIIQAKSIDQVSNFKDYARSNLID